MKFFSQTLLKVKSQLNRISRYFKPDFYPGRKINKGSMTGRKIEDGDSHVPNKKLCTEAKNTNNVVDAEKLKKRHVAMLLGYCGENYYGMQRNVGTSTIEDEILKALIKANFIPANSFQNLSALQFQRAARTDKGVSAVRQLVSFKISHNFNIEAINSHLPEQIRVFSIKRVTKGFNSKNDCVARTYSYTLPTYALSPEFHKEYPKDFRISKDDIIRINELLKSYLGSHRFHNFTSKKSFHDASSRRYIMSFEVGEPFVDQEEFITLTVKGQSFMLHQIRKMIGYVISIVKGLAPPNLNTNVWTAKKYSIPMAPSLGLVLEILHYDKYNKKFGSDGIHEPLCWDELNDEIENFKKKYILSNIIKKELEEKQMFHWISILPEHTYEYLDKGKVNDSNLKEMDEPLQDEIKH